MGPGSRTGSACLFLSETSCPCGVRVAFSNPPIIRADALGSCARACASKQPSPQPCSSKVVLRRAFHRCVQSPAVLHTSGQLAGAVSSCAHALVPRAPVCWLAAPCQCPASLVLLAAILSLTLNIPAYRFSLVTCVPLLMSSTTRSVLVWRPGPELPSGSSAHRRTGGRILPSRGRS